jgi:hypothetical protein
MSVQEVGRSQAWWYIPVIPALRRQRQKDHQLEVSLGYIVRPFLKKTKAGDVAQW